MADSLDVLVDMMHEHVQDINIESWAIKYYNDVLFYTKQYWEEHYDK